MPKPGSSKNWNREWPRQTLDTLLSTDIESYLPYDFLVKMDVATMANSMEARSPFLDHKLMEFCARLPVEYKIRGHTLKYLLRKSRQRFGARAKISRRRKMGFGVPVGRWMKGSQLDFVKETLLSPRALKRGYFRAETLRALVSNTPTRSEDYSQQLWALAVAGNVAPDVCRLDVQSSPEDRHERVLIVANWDWVIYNFRLPLARRSAAAGHEVILVCPEGTYVERIRARGFRVELWPLSRRSTNPFGELLAIGRLRSLYARLLPTIAHHFCLKPNFYGSLAALTLGHPQADRDQYLHRTRLLIFAPSLGGAVARLA